MTTYKPNTETQHTNTPWTGPCHQQVRETLLLHLRYPSGSSCILLGLSWTLPGKYCSRIAWCHTQNVHSTSLGSLPGLNLYNWHNVSPAPSGTCLCNKKKKNKKAKVKQSHYRPGQAQRVPAGWGSQISRQSAHEGGKVVNSTHRPLLPPRKYSWYSFLVEAESTPGP